MNKIFYAMAALALTTGFTACNDDDPTEAVSKHVYGDDEAPYLRTDASATITYAADFRKATSPHAPSTSKTTPRPSKKTA